MNKIFLLIIAILFVPLISNAYTFNRSLTIGSTGEDVRQLQIFLNNYSDETKVAQSGPGSKGNETTYFGNLTKNALIKLQDLNFVQILKPVGLIFGTGYFGPSTIEFINRNAPENIPQIQTSTTQKVQTNNNKKDFLILQKYTFLNDEITTVGSTADLTKTNFYINGKKLEKDCEYENLCEIKIKSSKSGEQILITDNVNMKEDKINVVFEDKKPVIDVDKIYLSKTNSISGENLTDTIKVYSIFETKEVKTNNGRFEVDFEVNSDKLEEYLQKGPFQIENSDGVTSDIIIVDYEI